MSRGRTIGFAAMAAALATTAVVFARARPATGFDARQGLLAVEQRLRGRDNPLWDIVIADQRDLTRDQLYAITWWAPGQQEIAYGLRRLGSSLPHTVWLISAGCWLAGIPAWSAFFWIALRDRRLFPWLVAVFALLRASHAGAFVYMGGETLLWALVPVVVLINIAAVRTSSARAGTALAFLAGVLTTGLVLFKYSASLLALAAAAWWLWWLFTRQATIRTAVASLVGAIVGAGLAFAGGVAHTITGNTPATPRIPSQAITVSVWTIGGPFIALSDANDAMTTVVAHYPIHGMGARALAVIGGAIVVSVVVWIATSWRAIRETVRAPAPARRAALNAAAAISIVVALGLMVLMLRGGEISYAARHQQYGAFLLLPFLADALWLACATSRSVPGRAIAIGAAAVLIGFPAAYGIEVLVLEAVERGPLARAETVVSGRSWLTREPDRVTALQDEMRAFPWFHDVTLAGSVPTALAFPEQRFIWAVGKGDTEDAVFEGHPAGGVALLLMPSPESPRDATVLRGQFRDIHAWQPIALRSAPDVRLWLGR